MVAAATALDGGLLDALGMLAMLTWAHEGWVITAVAFTTAYAVWAKDSRMITHLPDFATFLARLRPSPSAPKAPAENEDHGCLVCWSFEHGLLELPCHPGHHVCRSCLLRLYEADKYRCPLSFCRKMLFIYKSRRRRAVLRYLIVTSVTLSLAFRSIVLALQLYKGYYYAAAQLVFLTLFFVPVAWFSLFRLDREWILAKYHIAVLWVMLGLTVYNVWSTAVAVQTWDQVTLWDGAVLEGVEVWDTHEVVRTWYAAAD